MSTWEELRQECLNCRKCGLCQTRTNVVFGVGKENAEVMFIGEVTRSAGGSQRRAVRRAQRSAARQVNGDR